MKGMHNNSVVVAVYISFAVAYLVLSKQEKIFAQFKDHLLCRQAAACLKVALLKDPFSSYKGLETWLYSHLSIILPATSVGVALQAAFTETTQEGGRQHGAL